MLANIAIVELANYQASELGLDSRSRCGNLDHFDNYPCSVQYHYNSRGFRDLEWPQDSRLNQAVWCVGDSFTVGVGSVFEHTWPQILSQRLGRRTINVSMDGASNEWIARRCEDIAGAIDPCDIVVMWSYPHRRESSEPGSDHSRRRRWLRSTVQEDYENLLQCRKRISQGTGRRIELIIPNWQPVLTDTVWQNIRDSGWPPTAQQLTLAHDDIIRELVSRTTMPRDLLEQQLQAQQLGGVLDNVLSVPQLDWARDSHHFDTVTASWVADAVVSRWESQRV